MIEFDYIIIGGGLAGTILGDILKTSYSVLIIDKEAGEFGSKVAAGIVNPVTGRRMVKSWMVDTFAPFALDYYRSKEKEFGIELINLLDIQRLFHNEEQRKEWLHRVDFDQLQEIIESEIEPDENNEFWHKEFGGVSTSSSWRLNTSAFLDTLHNKWINEGTFFRDTIKYTDIEIGQGSVKVKNNMAKQLIFCEGWNMANNPWFGHLPIRPNKGEILTIEALGLQVNDLVHKGIFLLSLGQNQFKIGATYDRENIDYLPTETAKTWLIEKLEHLIKVPFKIIDHKVGIRPASLDRRPFVGTHNLHNNMHIFNGFGSKGIQQMPWIAYHFVDMLHIHSTLMPEIDINRFL